ncbi:MAG: DUF6174 domain-containing protein [Treponema sp.]|jgi:hypothetical protein|nr:DUF6174 domain-containing protein [Treponema sp.]
MKAKVLFLLLTAAFISCDNGTNTGEDTPLRESETPKNKTDSIYGPYVGFIWTAEPGADGYTVSYGASPECETVLETNKPYIAIGGLDIEAVYYFTIRTNTGGAVSSLPPNPIIMKDGDFTPGSCGSIIYYSPGEEAQDQFFDYEVFLAEKAAWEKQGIRHYRFIANTYAGQPYPYYQVAVLPSGETEITAANNGGFNSINLERPFEPGLTGKTIDELYESIGRAANDVEQGYRAVIQYHREYHYPESFVIGRIQPKPGDPGWPYGTSAGDGFSFKIREFEVLDETE